MQQLLLLAGPLTAFLITFVALAVMLRSGLAHAIAVDTPNHRSLHRAPVPRTGGLAIHLGLLPVWVSLMPGFATLAVATLVLAFASFWDDRHDLPIAIRFALHFVAAFLIVWSVRSQAPVLLLGLLLIAIVWVTNLYNFMDGSDGLAGGMALFGFAFLALAAVIVGDVRFAVLNLAIAAAAGAFLCFNFHPARVFMGDAGSIPLGFLAAAIGITGWSRDYWPLWFPLLVFAPFIVDASITLTRRILLGERFWEAHREHYYQRLVRMGLGHRKTAILEYALMIACGASALGALQLPVSLQAAVLAAWVVIYAALAVAIDTRWRNAAKLQGHSEARGGIG